MTLSVAALLFAAAITPGPNNFIVMNAASRGKLIAVAAPIAGIVTGTLGMVLSIRLGLDAALAQWPNAQDALRYVGAALLLYLAARAVIGGWTISADRGSSSNIGDTFLPMLLLQIVNPKTWVLAATVSTAHAAASNSLAVLALLIVTVPTICLAVWAIAGRALAPIMARSVPRRAFALSMGGALACFAIVLAISG